MAKFGSIKSDEEAPKVIPNVIDPTSNDDETLGYAMGDNWVNSLTHQTFNCVDATSGNAIWKKITDQGGSFSGTLDDIETGTINVHLTNTLKSNYDAAVAHADSLHAPSDAQKNSDITKAEIEAKLTGEITSHTHPEENYEAFPIGSIFTSVVATNPNILLGYGTWVAFGAGKVLIGLDPADTDFDTTEKTGGAKTMHPSAHAGVMVDNHIFTQPYDHAAKNTDQAGVGATQRGTTASTLTLKAHVHNITAYTHTGGGVDAHVVTQPDDHNSLSIVQPYIVVYFWERTA